jgi:hypothetical protein
MVLESENISKGVFGFCHTLKLPHFIIHMAHLSSSEFLANLPHFVASKFSATLLWLPHLPNLGLAKCGREPNIP